MGSSITVENPVPHKLLILYKTLVRVCIYTTMVLMFSGCVGLNSFSKVDNVSQNPTKPITEKALQRLLDDADIAYKTKRVDDAKLLYSAILQEDSKNQLALYRLGNLAFTQGDVDSAADFYYSLLSINSGHSRSHYNLGVCRLIQARGHLQNYILMKDPASDSKAIEQMVRQINSFAERQAGRR